MLAEIAKKYYLEKGANCSEAVVKAANEAYGLGLDEQALKLVSGFGGGCGCGDLCGAIAGALSVLSVLSVGPNRAHGTEGFGPLFGEAVQTAAWQHGLRRNQAQICISGDPLHPHGGNRR